MFRDTEVSKGPQLSTTEILDLQTHFKPTEPSSTRTSYPVTLLIPKEGFIKGKVLRLLRTNSVKEIFETSNKGSVKEAIP